MNVMQQAACIFYVLETLLQTPLRMIEMTKCVWHPSIPLHSHFIPTLSQQFSIELTFISFKIKLGSDNMCRCQILK